MKSLAYPLLDTVEINGKEYKVNLAFDNVLRLIDMLNDDEINDLAQIELGTRMLIGESLDLPLEQKEEVFYQLFTETINKGLDDEDFNRDIEGNPMPVADGGDNKETYCLKQDAPYIYASFMSDYGIDLFEAHGKLHWEKFKALLSGLTDGSKFLRVIEIRTMELPTGKGSEKQRAQIKRMKKAYELKEIEGE